MIVTPHRPLTFRANKLVQPAEQPEVAQEPQDNPAPARGHRGLRKAVTRVGGILAGAYHTLTGIPEGIVAGVHSVLGTDRDQVREHVAKAYTTSSTVVGGAIGMALGGPFGLVVGLAGGFILGSLGNWHDARSQNLDHLLDKVGERAAQATQGVPEDKKTSRLVRGVLSGALEGAKHGWKHGRVSGAITTAGMLDGFAFAKRDAEKDLQAHQGAEPKKMTVRGALELAMGSVCGVAGALINGPAGLVLGALEATKDPEAHGRPAISRPLLLFATNIGKALGPAVVGAALGGPVGAAVGTAVGLVSGSLPSMVDGKFGFNSKSVAKVDEAVKEATGEQEFKSNDRVYYRAGQGAVVGAYSGVREGWSSGYKGGVDILRYLWSTPGDAVDQD